MKFEKIFVGEKKALALGITVVLLANTAGLILYFLENKSAEKRKTEYLERRGYGQGDYEEKLTVRSEKGKQNITVYVRERIQSGRGKGNFKPGKRRNGDSYPRGK